MKKKNNIEFKEYGYDNKISQLPAICPYCYKIFKNDAEIEKHMKSAHKVNF